MTTATATKSGKSERDENFPVASVLIAPRHRAAILAFYRFARAADDVADNPRLGESDKLRLLDQLEATLLDQGGQDPEALPLRDAIARHGLSVRHALDLLIAFRQDVTQRRYQTWDELMTYCRYSAMPVGRFVLDVHGESPSTWPASDALCASLQVINHLQDCAKDYAAINRVYIPLELMAANSVEPEALAAPAASPGLRRCIVELASRTKAMLARSGPLHPQVQDVRLCAETAVIGKLAARLTELLLVRDPLSEAVHLGKVAALTLAVKAVGGAVAGRVWRSAMPASRTEGAQ